MIVAYSLLRQLYNRFNRSYERSFLLKQFLSMTWFVVGGKMSILIYNAKCIDGKIEVQNTNWNCLSSFWVQRIMTFKIMMQLFFRVQMILFWNRMKCLQRLWAVKSNTIIIYLMIFWLVSCSLLNNSINRRIFSFICVGSQRQSDYNQIIIDASANIISNFWDFWEKQNLVRLLLNPPLTLYHVGGQTGSVWLTYEQA